MLLGGKNISVELEYEGHEVYYSVNDEEVWNFEDLVSKVKDLLS